MRPEGVPFYCQRCLAANTLGQEFCERCGTPLMIVVEPRAARFESAESSVSQEEHLIERISSVENRMIRITDRIEQTLNLMLKQAQNHYFDHSLLEALIDLLASSGVIDPEKLHELWEQRNQREEADQSEKIRLANLREGICRRYTGKLKAPFVKLVEEALNLINTSDRAAAIQHLQEAAAESPDNFPLLAFVGEQLFGDERIGEARVYFERADALEPKNPLMCLILGFLDVENGDTQQGKALLRTALMEGHDSFTVHYALGRLLATENEWASAIEEFKLALAAEPLPEMNYALACAYLAYERPKFAVKELRLAIEKEECFDEAHYLMKLIKSRQISGRRGVLWVPEEGDDGSNSVVLVEDPDEFAEPLMMPGFFAALRPGNPKLISGGDRGMEILLRHDILCSLAKLEAS